MIRNSMLFEVKSIAALQITLIRIHPVDRTLALTYVNLVLLFPGRRGGARHKTICSLLRQTKIPRELLGMFPDLPYGSQSGLFPGIDRLSHHAPPCKPWVRFLSRTGVTLIPNLNRSVFSYGRELLRRVLRLTPREAVSQKRTRTEDIHSIKPSSPSRFPLG